MPIEDQMTAENLNVLALICEQWDKLTVPSVVFYSLRWFAKETQRAHVVSGLVSKIKFKSNSTQIPLISRSCYQFNT